MSVKEQKSFLELQSRDDIVITDADKGGTIVIFDVEDCVKEAERQLHNTETTKDWITESTTIQSTR